MWWLVCLFGHTVGVLCRSRVRSPESVRIKKSPVFTGHAGGVGVGGSGQAVLLTACWLCRLVVVAARREATSQTCQYMFVPLWGKNRGSSRGCHLNRVHLCEPKGVKIIVLCALKVEILNIQVSAHQLLNLLGFAHMATQFLIYNS